MDSLNLPNLKPPQIADHLIEIRIDIVKRASLVLMGVAALASWMSMSFEPFPFGAFLILLSFIGAAAVCRSTVADHPYIARVMLFASATAAMLAIELVEPAVWIPFVVLPVVLLGSVLIEHGELIAGGAALVLTILLDWLGWRDYLLLEYSVALLLTMSIGWIVTYMLNTSLTWYQVTLEQSNRLLRETREHRGELSKVLKNLMQANELQRRTEQELIEARRSAEEARITKERFAAKVSHEMRTPLALIAGFSEVMYNSPEIYGDVTWSPTMRRDISQVYHNSHHLLEMVDDILNLSRIDLTGFSIALENISLKEFLEETAAIARDLFKGNAVHFSLSINENLPSARIDPTRIRQVILNLINNARRFTEKGEVVLSARAIEQEVVISVKDTGPGIAQDKLDLIFQEFYQVEDSLLRTKGGTGLGLAICKHFVETHGGHIWAESEVNHGSVFNFSLPLGGPFMSDQIDYGKMQPTPPTRVLVFGADDHILAMLRSEISGYDIQPVEKFEILEQALATYHPRALIWNVLPGDEMEMEHLFTHVDIPIIRCSLPSTLWIVKKYNLHACLSKPITRSMLVHEMERLPVINRILVVDDDPDFVQLVQRIVQSINTELEILVAADGLEGLSRMRSERPDLVLLDLTMPGLDGFGVIAEMRQDADLCQLPVVLLTATLTPERLLNFPSTQIVVERKGEMKTIESLGLIKASLDALQTHYEESTDDVIRKINEPA